MDRTAVAATFAAVDHFAPLPLTVEADHGPSLRSLCGPLGSGCTPMPWPSGVWLTAPGPPAAATALAHPERDAMEDRAVALQLATTQAAVELAADLVAAAVAGDTRAATAYAGMLAAADAARRSAWFSLLDRTQMRWQGAPVESRRPAGLDQLLGEVLTGIWSGAEAGLTDRDVDRFAADAVDRFLSRMHAGVLDEDVVADLFDFGWLSLEDPDAAIRDAVGQVVAGCRVRAELPPRAEAPQLVVLPAAPLVELSALAVACCPFSVSPWDRTVAVLVPAQAAPALSHLSPEVRSWPHPPVFSLPLVVPPRYGGGAAS